MTYILVRQKIIEQIVNRLANDGSGDGKGLRRTTDPDTGKAEWNIGNTPIYVGIGQRNWPPPAPDVTIIPFESGFTRTANHPYDGRMVVAIQVTTNYSDPFNIHRFGNHVLGRIQEAIELDIRLKEMVVDSDDPDFGKVVRGDGFGVKNFQMVDMVVVDRQNGVIEASIMFVFNYFESYLGNRRG